MRCFNQTARSPPRNASEVTASPICVKIAAIRCHHAAPSQYWIPARMNRTQATCCSWSITTI